MIQTRGKIGIGAPKSGQKALLFAHAQTLDAGA